MTVILGKSPTRVTLKDAQAYVQQTNTPREQKVQHYYEGHVLGPPDAGAPAILDVPALRRDELLDTYGLPDVRYWTGPLPARTDRQYATVVRSLVKSVDTFNFLATGADQIVSTTGTPRATYQVRPRRRLNDDGALTDAERDAIHALESVIDEAMRRLGLIRRLVDAHTHGALHGRGLIRLRLTPAGRTAGEGGRTRLRADARTLRAATRMIDVEIPTWGRWAVVKDEDTGDEYSVILLGDGDTQTAEVAWTDEDGLANVVTLTAAGRGAPLRVDLGGLGLHIPLDFGRPLIRADTVTQQESYSVGATISNANMGYGFYARQYAIGLQPPLKASGVRKKQRAAEIETLLTNPRLKPEDRDALTAEQANLTLTPDDMDPNGVDSGSMTYLQATVVESATHRRSGGTTDTTINRAPYNGAQIGRLEPISTDSMDGAMERARRDALSSMNLGWKLLADSEYTNAKARRNAAAQHLTDAHGHAVVIREALEALCEVVARALLRFAGQPDVLDDYRVEGIVTPSVGKDTPTIPELLSLHDRHLLTPELTQALSETVSPEDADAAMTYYRARMAAPTPTPDPVTPTPGSGPSPAPLPVA